MSLFINFQLLKSGTKHIISIERGVYVDLVEQNRSF